MSCTTSTYKKENVSNNIASKGMVLNYPGSHFIFLDGCMPANNISKDVLMNSPSILLYNAFSCNLACSGTCAKKQAAHSNRFPFCRIYFLHGKKIAWTLGLFRGG